MAKSFVNIADLVNAGRPNVLLHLGRGDVIQSKDNARAAARTFVILGKSGDTLAVVPHADGLKVGTHADGIKADDPTALSVSLGTVVALYTKAPLTPAAAAACADMANVIADQAEDAKRAAPES